MGRIARPGTVRRIPEDVEEADANRQTMSLAGLAAALAVLVVCLFLVHQLRRQSMVDDCLMAGRSNCDLVMTRLH
jgi:uncharacterized membrane protein